MAWNFEGIGPEDLDDLIQSATQHRQSLGGGSDQQQDKELIQPLFEAVQMIAERVDQINDRLDKLEDHYFNQFIGGLEELYNDNQRHDGVELLRSKYNDDFEPFADLIRETLGEGQDIFGHMYDHLNDHWDEDDFDPDDFMESIIDELKARHGRMRKMFGGGEEEEVKPKGEVEVEITTSKKKPRMVDEITDKDIEKIMKHPSMRMMAG